MARIRSGHIERLPSGSFRVHVYAGTDPVTGRPLRLKKTVKTEERARIELGKLLEQADSGRRPDADATVADLLSHYVAVVDWEVSTWAANKGDIRRTILPALGDMKLRRVRGPLLDSFYARLRRCGNVRCTGKPTIEHNYFPALAVDPTDRRPARQQIAEAIRDAIGNGQLAPGDSLLSVREVVALHGVRRTSVQRAFAMLAEQGKISVRHGRRAVVADHALDVDPPRNPSGRSRRPKHDCAQSGCRPHECHPMHPQTIRAIHAILSGAFGAAVRWELIDRNPANSAKPPKVPHRAPTAPTPEEVAKVISAAREQDPAVATYLWLAAVTGARRGELCGLQWNDIDLEQGVVHIASNYLVQGGQRIRKDTKTHQDRHLAIDEVTITMLGEHKERILAALDGSDVELPPNAYVFSNDPLGVTAWNPDWVTHQVRAIADHVGVGLNIKALRHYTASQLLAGGIDLRNTVARLGHGSGGATTLRHYADPVSEVDRRAAAYLAQLTAPPSTANDS